MLWGEASLLELHRVVIVVLDLGSNAEVVRLESNQIKLNYRIVLEFLSLRSIEEQLTSRQEVKGLTVRKIRLMEHTDIYFEIGGFPKEK
jgi:hypothetical protein